MSYSKSLLVYQDKPAYGLFLKLIMIGVPAGLLIASIFLWSSGDSTGGIALLGESFLTILIFWLVFPRSYQIYEDHLRIKLGGPFAVKVGFDNIKEISVTSRLAMTMNFVTRFTKRYVEIDKKKGLSIAITPNDDSLFVENAKQALSQWTVAS
ncbi:PH domain-containing protein [Chloroflexota bacterium]